jgi:putative aldouronate transport system permease protein
MYKENTGDKIFNVFNNILMIVIVIITLYPFYYIICASLSDTSQLLIHTGLLLKPLETTFGAYKLTFQYPLILYGYKNTLFILLFGLPINMILSVFCGYMLTAKNVLYKKFIIAFVMLTMYFSGGLVPSYLNVRSLGLYNSLWAVILPGAISVYNTIIIKTAMAGIPDSLSEAAYIDGANSIEILFRVVIPLIKPTLAVITLYYAVTHWNSWFSAAIYIKDNVKLPIQAVMRAILIENDELLYSNALADDGTINTFVETIKYALIVVGTLPILVLYPFLQRYFVKGVMIGAVKG